MPEEVVIVNKGNKKEKMVVNKQVVVTTVSKPIHGFWQFLTQREIMFLALGVIIADSVKSVVNALVDGLIRPFISLFMPGTDDLKALIFTVNGAQFKLGDVISALLQMAILFFLLYFVVVVLLRQQKAFEQNLGIQNKKAKAKK